MEKWGLGYEDFENKPDMIMLCQSGRADRNLAKQPSYGFKPWL
jgi:hypothetical protein